MKLTGEWVKREPIALLPEASVQYARGVSVNNGWLASCRFCHEQIWYDVELRQRHGCVTPFRRAALYRWRQEEAAGERWLVEIGERYGPSPFRRFPPKNLSRLAIMESFWWDSKDWEQIAYERRKDK